MRGSNPRVIFASIKPFIAGAAGAEHLSDDALVETHLLDMGMAVRDAPAETAPNLAGVDLIVVSYTADPYRLHAAFRSAAVPVLTWNQPAYANLAMTGSKAHIDFEVIGPQQFFARSFAGARLRHGR